ncbi:hypothetical protein B551_0225065 [Cupriavidus sp. HPC(L)]|nr:hypothetical protein B551_0225065 [Cupriavidus sp. HPC(L)]
MTIHFAPQWGKVMRLQIGSEIDKLLDSYLV